MGGQTGKLNGGDENGRSYKKSKTTKQANGNKQKTAFKRVLDKREAQAKDRQKRDQTPQNKNPPRAAQAKQAKESHLQALKHPVDKKTQHTTNSSPHRKRRPDGKTSKRKEPDAGGREDKGRDVLRRRGYARTGEGASSSETLGCGRNALATGKPLTGGRRAQE